MPLNQPGNNAYVSIRGTVNDVAGDQHNITNYYNHPSNSYARETQRVLMTLDPVDMDASQRRLCLKGTRTEITNYVIQWVMNMDMKRTHTVLWLRGLAGSGKSTLSTTIAKELNEMGRLAAFVFFERDNSSRSDPFAVIRTLAYKLGVSHPQVGEVISAMVIKNPEVTHFPLESQFRHLLVQPMISEGIIDPALPLVFVLDALDECGTPDKRESLLVLLAEQASELPALFVIASRPSQDICGFLENNEHVLVKELDITTRNNHDDISTFLKKRLQLIRNKRRSVRRRTDWPGDDAFQQLLSRASGLFIWAVTACNFIDNHSPQARLEMIIRGPSATEAEHALDTIYRTALDSAGSWDIPEFVIDFRAVLGFILIARRPLSGTDMTSLLGSSVTEGCIDVISQLGCVLQLNPTIRLLHPSFADFLFDSQRCIKGIFHFEEAILHHSLALTCIKRLDNALKGSLCNMSLSPNYGQVAEDIAYASMYLVEHTSMTSDCGTIIPALETFVGRHFMDWVDTMSLLSTSRTMIGILEQFHTWLRIQVSVPSGLSRLVDEGIQFVRRHAAVIHTHPLLVYSSALPFEDPKSLLYEKFHDPTRSLGPGERSLAQPSHVLLGPSTSWVNSVAFSPDGTRIASGSDDQTIRLWDISSGVGIFTPMQGHECKVLSVAFSPDGSLIVSGSNDGTVRLWDPSTCTEVPPRMRGTNASLAFNSVAFSPNAKFVIAGSNDMHIHIWDVHSGTEIRPPLQGHFENITSVCVSPDGARIASGSVDETVRVWDFGTGLEILPPLTGHVGTVNSVAFSPNGSLIASGSDDTTICLWNANSGLRIPVPFSGHSRDVLSVRFSPDETHLVSGSFDQTIRMWDVITGVEVSPPLMYCAPLLSLSLSPDGTRIVSGGRGGSMQVWDAISSFGSTPPTVTTANDVQ